MTDSWDHIFLGCLYGGIVLILIVKYVAHRMQEQEYKRYADSITAQQVEEAKVQVNKLKTESIRDSKEFQDAKADFRKLDAQSRAGNNVTPLPIKPPGGPNKPA